MCAIFTHPSQPTDSCGWHRAFNQLCICPRPLLLFSTQLCFNLSATVTFSLLLTTSDFHVIMTLQLARIKLHFGRKRFFFPVTHLVFFPSSPLLSSVWHMAAYSRCDITTAHLGSVPPHLSDSPASLVSHAFLLSSCLCTHSHFD